MVQIVLASITWLRVDSRILLSGSSLTNSNREYSHLLLRLQRQEISNTAIKFAKSSRSARKNISEGFGRYYPGEFARFLRTAVGSLHETKDHLLEWHVCKYLDDADYERLLRLALRAIKAANRFIAYLRHAKAPEPFWRVCTPEEQTSEHPEHGKPSGLREPSEPREPFEPREPSEPT
jgi:four helix bundle protein